jgi:hypothetical protein
MGKRRVDHILTDKRRHSNILDVQSFRGDACDTDHYLVLAVRGLSISKRPAQEFNVEIFNLKISNDMEVKEEYHVKI